jgi:hypothetical protein
LVLGRIEQIHGRNLTLRTRRGWVTVLTDEETRFFLPGSGEAHLQGRLSDLAVGKIIAAAGTWEGRGTLSARIVGARPR